MKRKLFFGTLALLVLTIVGAFAFGFVNPAQVGDFLVEFLVGGGSGAIFAAGGLVAGTTVTTETADTESPNLLRPDISQKITQIMPSTTPLDTLIREAGAHEKTEALMFKFYSAELRPFTDALDSAFTRDSGVTPANGYEIVVTNVNIWQTDDGILFHGITGGDGGPLVGHIIKKVNSTKKLTVVFLNGTGDDTNIPPASIADETKVGRLANAKSELDAKTDPYGHLPLDSYNYVQAHMAQVEESFWQKAHAKEVNWDIRDMQTMSIFDLRCQMEAASIFGVRKKIFDVEGNDWKYLSGGAVRFAGQSLTFDPTATIDNAAWTNWTKKLFTGNAGSDRRYAFLGSDLIERLHDVDIVSKQIDGTSTEVVFGITFRRIETNFGIIMLKHHPLFNSYGYANGGVVLDLNNVRKRVFEPMKVRKLDLISSGEKKANAYVLEETFGLEFRYPDTHAVITPTSAH